MNSNAIVGYGNKRTEKDFYPTPPDVTQALIDYLNIPKSKTIWECASGSGDMVRVLEGNGYKVKATDIDTGNDFLEHYEDCDWVITNPPFSISEQFIKRALDIGKPFAFLLKSQYWHSKKRLPLFRIAPPTAVLPLTWRPDFTGQGSSLMDMCWMVWDKPTTVYVPLDRPLQIKNLMQTESGDEVKNEAERC